MGLLDKVKDRAFICGVEISFNATAIPSAIQDWQQFFNSTFSSLDFQKAYSGKSYINFGEESVESAAGTSYKQKMSFRFPVTDHQRAERISEFKKIKFAKLKISNGLDIVIGRNDFHQNTKPVVKITADEHMCEVAVESQSIFPSGFTPNPNRYGLPTYVPVTLL